MLGEWQLGCGGLAVYPYAKGIDRANLSPLCLS